MKSRRLPSGFTLIELLIVVAIIAILAAIAVPNFLEAQVRSKVARNASDFRTMATAIESYRIDANKYMNSYPSQTYEEALNWLTTPVSYLTSIPQDPFRTDKTKSLNLIYIYDNLEDSPAEAAFKAGIIAAYFPFMHSGTQWYITGVGPDQVYEAEKVSNAPYKQYDPTNGTISQGDIWRIGP